MALDRMPLVSVVITTFNRAEFVGKAIDSALKQDYGLLEIIICDNCSEDNTAEVVKTYLVDQRISYYRNENNIGMIGNFQKAIGLAQGKYITMISSDDYLINTGFITEAVSLFSKFKSAVLVKGVGNMLTQGKDEYEPYYNHVYDEGLVSGKEAFLGFEKRGSIGFDACLIDNEILKKTEICYDPKMTSLDFEINSKMCLLGDIVFINKPCYVFTIHGDQASKSYSNEVLWGNIRIIERARDFATGTGYFQKDQLDRWYFNIVYELIRYNYIKRYFQDAALFSEYKKLAAKLYPVIYKKVISEKRIVLLRLLYNRYYNFSKLLRFVKPSYGRVIDNFKKNYQ